MLQTLIKQLKWKVNEGANMVFSVDSPGPLFCTVSHVLSLLPEIISHSPPTQSLAIWAIPVGLVPKPTATDLAF